MSRGEKLFWAVLFLAALAGLMFGGCTTRGFPAQHGIVNLDRVDWHLIRGGQPGALGLDYLKSRGCDMVINLRDDAWLEEGRVCAELGMGYRNVPMSGTGTPRREDVREVLRLIAMAPGPVFVHCEHGCDRTGVIVACYRIRYGDSAAVALQDAEVHGMSALEAGMKGFIKGFAAER